MTVKSISQYLTEQFSGEAFEDAQALLKEIVYKMRYSSILNGYVPVSEEELVEFTVSPSIDEVYDGDMIHFDLCGYRVTILEYYHDAGSNFYAYVFEVYDGKRTYSSLTTPYDHVY